MNPEDEKTDTLGEQMRAMREGFGLSIDALARMTSVSPRQIRALEQGEYGVFGAKVYAKGVLKKALLVMAPENDDELMRALDREWRIFSPGEPQYGESAGTAHKSNAFYLTPARVGIALAAVALAIFIFFAGGRLIRFSTSPLLSVDEPTDKSVLQEPMILARGRTEKESKLTVNGRELTIDGEGHFEERIELQPGVNRLTFLSENRFGKQSHITKYVVVE